MDIEKEREAFEELIDIEIIISEGFKFNPNINQYYHPDHTNHRLSYAYLMGAWMVWQEKAQAVPEQLDVNSILHDIDCYFDNGLSNTERTANNLLQSIYEKLSGEVKAQEPAND